MENISSVNEIENKYSLEKDFKEKLKIFFMAVRPGPPNFLSDERFVGIISYTHDSAFQKGNEIFLKDKSKNLSLISHGDYELMENILGNLELVGKAIVIEKEKIIEKPAEKIGIEQFKNSLKLILNDYIKDENDRIFLARIINTIDKQSLSSIK